MEFTDLVVSAEVRRLDTNLQTLRARTDRSMTKIQNELNSLSEELRALRREIESERFSAELRRWFWLYMLASAVFNLAIAAALSS
jgi:hypothetical protein